jgi:hypothetical protein
MAVNKFADLTLEEFTTRLGKKTTQNNIKTTHSPHLLTLKRSPFALVADGGGDDDDDDVAPHQSPDEIPDQSADNSALPFSLSLPFSHPRPIPTHRLGGYGQDRRRQGSRFMRFMLRFFCDCFTGLFSREREKETGIILFPTNISIYPLFRSLQSPSRRSPPL